MKKIYIYIGSIKRFERKRRKERERERAEVELNRPNLCLFEKKMNGYKVYPRVRSLDEIKYFLFAMIDYIN